MANVERIRIVWDGFIGGPGVTTIYATDAAALLAPLHTFFTAIAGDMPATVHWTFPSDGDVLDAVSGTLVSAWAGTAPAAVVGTDTGGYQAPSGIMVKWLTGTIIGGHRLVGRTYLVPAADSNFESNRTLTAGRLTIFQNAATALVTASAGNMVVWSRPPAGGSGGFSAVSSAVVPDKVAVLRSRRD